MLHRQISENWTTSHSSPNLLPNVVASHQWGPVSRSAVLELRLTSLPQMPHHRKHSVSEQHFIGKMMIDHVVVSSLFSDKPISWCLLDSILLCLSSHVGSGLQSSSDTMNCWHWSSFRMSWFGRHHTTPLDLEATFWQIYLAMENHLT